MAVPIHFHAKGPSAQICWQPTSMRFLILAEVGRVLSRSSNLSRPSTAARNFSLARCLIRANLSERRLAKASEATIQNTGILVSGLTRFRPRPGMTLEQDLLHHADFTQVLLHARMNLLRARRRHERAL